MGAVSTLIKRFLGRVLFEDNIGVLGNIDLAGTLATGSVPAARIDSGTLAVARSWAYAGGDVTAAAGSAVLTIANGAVTSAKMANMAQATFKGRAAGAGTGAPVDLSATQAKAALSIAYADVSGLGTLALQNATTVTVGSLSASGGVTSTNSSNSFFGEGLGTGFNGDVFQAYSSNPTGSGWYAFRVYNSFATPIAGWRGDGAVVAVVMVQAPNFVVTQINKGTVTTTVAIDWRQGAYQTFTLTTATNCTATMTAPQGPGDVTLKMAAPAAGTVPTVTWPATVKGGAPTTVTNLGRYNVLRFFWDGTNYNYLGGAINIA